MGHDRGVGRWWAVMFVAALALGACAADEAPAPPSTSAAAPSTTAGPPPTSSTTPVPTPAVQVLVAHEQGIDLWTPGGTTTVLTGRPVELAVPDLVGGVVFQGPRSGWDDAVAIEHLAAPGAEPEVLVAPGPAIALTLVEVAEVGGDRLLVFHRTVEDPNDCEAVVGAGPECRWAHVHEDLVVRDLTTGAETTLGTVGSFESSSVEVHVGWPRMATGIVFYGDEGWCVGWFAAERLLDRPGGGWIGAGGLLEDTCLRRSADACPEGRWCAGSVRVGIARDGVRVAWAEWGTEGDPEAGSTLDRPLVLTVVDPAGAVPELVVEVGGPDAMATAVEVGDEVVLVGRARRSGPGRGLDAVLVDRDGGTTVLDVGGTVRLWVHRADPARGR